MKDIKAVLEKSGFVISQLGGNEAEGIVEVTGSYRGKPLVVSYMFPTTLNRSGAYVLKCRIPFTAFNEEVRFDGSESGMMTSTAEVLKKATEFKPDASAIAAFSHPDSPYGSLAEPARSQSGLYDWVVRGLTHMLWWP